MFQQPKVEVFMNNASLAGKKEKKVVRFIFYVTPFTHYLAAQISPEIADTLFHDDGRGDMKPSLVLPDAGLDIGNISLQKMFLHPSDDPKMDKYGAMLGRVQISDLGVRKIFPDDPNFSLIFRAEAPIDKLAVELAQKYYQEKLFITFEAMQGEMFPASPAKCGYCEDPPVAKDSAGSLLCQKDVKKGTGVIEWLKPRETPAEAEERVVAEAGRAAGLTVGGTVTAIPDKDDASYINRKRTKREGALMWYQVLAHRIGEESDAIIEIYKGSFDANQYAADEIAEMAGTSIEEAIRCDVAAHQGAKS